MKSRFVPYLAWVPAVCLMAAISFVSHIPGDNIHLPGFFSSDKLGHLAAYFLLGALLRLAAQKGKGGLAAALLAGMAHAVGDEIHQRFVPLREFSLWDMAADFIGLWAGLFFSQAQRRELGCLAGRCANGMKASISQEKLRGGRLHRLLGDRLFEASLWRPEPRAVTLGLVIGIFIGLTPTFPLQIGFAVVAAFYLRANIPAAFLACWVNNPVTLVPIYEAEMCAGLWLLGWFRNGAPPGAGEVFHQAAVLSRQMLGLAPGGVSGAGEALGALALGGIVLPAVVTLLAYPAIRLAVSTILKRDSGHPAQQ